MQPVIQANNLSFSYSGAQTKLLDNVNFAVEPHDFVGIIGGNGSGKSTLLKLILGLLKPQTGDVKIFAKNIDQVRDRIGYLSQFEEVDLSFPLTAFDVVLMGRANGKIINNYSDEDRKKVEEIMQDLGIVDLRDANLRNLSGGQKQKVFLARALVNDPELLILDEPLTNIDMQSQQDLYHILQKLNKHKTIIIVDHNLEMLLPYVNKVFCVNRCEAEGVKVHTDNLHELTHI